MMRSSVAFPSYSNRDAYAMTKQRRFTHSMPLKDRLSSFAEELREQAALLTPGPERDDLLRRARQADTALHLDDWANSPGLRSPE